MYIHHCPLVSNPADNACTVNPAQADGLGAIAAFLGDVFPHVANDAAKLLTAVSMVLILSSHTLAKHCTDSICTG